MNPRGRPRHTIESDDLQRWAELREQGETETALHIAAKTAELSEIDMVAWLAGGRMEGEHLDKAVAAARANGATWVEIAAALGEPTDSASAGRVSSRFFKRQKR